MDFLSALLEDIRRLFPQASPLLTFLTVLRAIVGFILVFFLPGFAWTLVFFRQIKTIERIALSFGLSIAVVTLSILALNLVMGMRLTTLNIIMVIIVITAIPMAIYYISRLIRHWRAKSS